jgi:hypothetical protein
LADKRRRDYTGDEFCNGLYIAIRFVRPGGRRGNGPIWTVRCRNGHEFECAAKKMKRNEICCQDCVAELRTRREEEHRIRTINRAVERERKAAVRAAVRLGIRQARKLERDLKRERRRLQKHANCYGRHSLGKGRTVTCKEYEAERTRQSLAQGGTGTPADRDRRKRDHDFMHTVVKRILERDGYRCRRCGRHRRELGEGERLEADHVTAGVGTSAEDGQTLCSRCHSWKHKSRSRDGLCFPTGG